MDDPEQIADPKFWRGKAEEARVLGEVMKDPIAKATMARTAANCERYAKLAEDFQRSLIAFSLRSPR